MTTLLDNGESIRISDEAWREIRALLIAECPATNTGRPRCDMRRVIDAIIHYHQADCGWNHIPDRYGNDRMANRWYLRWRKSGTMEKIWSIIVEHHPELSGLDLITTKATAGMKPATPPRHRR